MRNMWLKELIERNAIDSVIDDYVKGIEENRKRRGSAYASFQFGFYQSVGEMITSFSDLKPQHVSACIFTHLMKEELDFYVIHF